MNRHVLYTGIGLLLGGALLNMVLGAATDSYENDPLDGLGGLLMLTGLILIIVGAVKGSGTRQQQQQQQVVVYAGAPHDPSPAAPRLDLRCPTCATLNERNARFCMECGKPVDAPRTFARKAAPRPKKARQRRPSA